MTGRTHDLAAFTSLSYIFLNSPLIDMSLATLICAFIANFIGALFPDLDNASSDLWHRVRGGSIFSKLITPLLGGHRMISHSLIGFALTAFLLNQFLTSVSHIILVDMKIVLISFLIGYASHLLTDAFTKEGVPFLFPLPLYIGFPPFKFLRIKTGGRLEKSFIYPGLILLTLYLYYSHYSKALEFLQHHLH